MTSGVVKPNDLRQQFGGSVGGAIVRDKIVLLLYAGFAAAKLSCDVYPGYAGLYSLTSTQTALLSLRGVSPTKINAALNYLNSLTGTVARRQDQDINFMKMDWQAAERHRLSVEYNRARMDAPAGARSGAVVDRGLASLGSSYVQVDAVMGRWMWTRGDRVSNEVRVHFGRELEYETAQTPLPQEPAIGPDGFAPQVSIGPQGLIFGTPASLGRKAYPDERRVEARDLATWVTRAACGAGGWGFRLRCMMRLIRRLMSRDVFVRQRCDEGKAGGLVDGLRTIRLMSMLIRMAGALRLCRRCMISVSGLIRRVLDSDVAFDTQEWAGFVEDSLAGASGAECEGGGAV